MKIVICTGGYDPIHSGHIAYFHAAKQLGDKLIIGVNSDPWLSRKKGRSFMPLSERLSIVSALKVVDEVITYNDDDGSSKDAIVQIHQKYPDAELIFANGGDRTKDNIPEMDLKINNLSFVFGVGGEDKKNSSSWILSEWKHLSEQRVWGKFLTYYDSTIAKVKRLVIEPGKSISMQYHEHRSELWFVEYGLGEINTIGANGEQFLLKTVKLHDYHQVPVNTWHKLTNTGNEPLSIIEIQYGESCTEVDIIRKH
jgi:cytidyltransferase-like protein